MNKIEDRVCEEFEASIEDLKKTYYNNVPRKAMIYLAVFYCGLPLKDTRNRYGGSTETAVCKLASRFKERLSKDKDLRKKIENIMTIDKIPYSLLQLLGYMFQIWKLV